jgi:hypothetical protein
VHAARLWLTVRSHLIGNGIRKRTTRAVLRDLKR